MPPVGDFRRGKINILSLVSIGFLVISLISIVSFTNNPLKTTLVGIFAAGKKFQDVKPDTSTRGSNMGDKAVRDAERTGSDKGWTVNGKPCSGTQCLDIQNGTLQTDAQKAAAEASQKAAAAAGIVVPAAPATAPVYPNSFEQRDAGVTQTVTQNPGTTAANQKPAAAQPEQPTSPGYSHDQVVNSVNTTPNTVGYNAGNGTVSGYYESGGRYFPIGGTGNNPATYEATSLAAKNVSNVNKDLTALNTATTSDERTKILADLQTYIAKGYITQPQYDNLHGFARAQDVIAKINSSTTSAANRTTLLAELNSLVGRGITQTDYSQIANNFITQADYGKCTRGGSAGECGSILQHLGEQQVTPDLARARSIISQLQYGGNTERLLTELKGLANKGVITQDTYNQINIQLHPYGLTGVTAAETKFTSPQSQLAAIAYSYSPLSVPYEYDVAQGLGLKPGDPLAGAIAQDPLVGYAEIKSAQNTFLRQCGNSAGCIQQSQNILKLASSVNDPWVAKLMYDNPTQSFDWANQAAEQYRLQVGIISLTVLGGVPITAGMPEGIEASIVAANTASRVAVATTGLPVTVTQAVNNCKSGGDALSCVGYSAASIAQALYVIAGGTTTVSQPTEPSLADQLFGPYQNKTLADNLFKNSAKVVPEGESAGFTLADQLFGVRANNWPTTPQTYNVTGEFGGLTPPEPWPPTSSGPINPGGPQIPGGSGGVQVQVQTQTSVNAVSSTSLANQLFPMANPMENLLSLPVAESLLTPSTVATLAVPSLSPSLLSPSTSLLSMTAGLLGYAQTNLESGNLSVSNIKSFDLTPQGYTQISINATGLTSTQPLTDAYGILKPGGALVLQGATNLQVSAAEQAGFTLTASSSTGLGLTNATLQKPDPNPTLTALNDFANEFAQTQTTEVPAIATTPEITFSGNQTVSEINPLPSFAPEVQPLPTANAIPSTPSEITINPGTEIKPIVTPEVKPLPTTQPITHIGPTSIPVETQKPAPTLPPYFIFHPAIPGDANCTGNALWRTCTWEENGMEITVVITPLWYHRTENPISTFVVEKPQGNVVGNLNVTYPSSKTAEVANGLKADIDKTRESVKELIRSENPGITDAEIDQYIKDHQNPRGTTPPLLGSRKWAINQLLTQLSNLEQWVNDHENSYLIYFAQVPLGKMLQGDQTLLQILQEKANVLDILVKLTRNPVLIAIQNLAKTTPITPQPSVTAPIPATVTRPFDPDQGDTAFRDEVRSSITKSMGAQKAQELESLAIRLLSENRAGTLSADTDPKIATLDKIIRYLTNNDSYYPTSNGKPISKLLVLQKGNDAQQVGAVMSQLAKRESDLAFMKSYFDKALAGTDALWNEFSGGIVSDPSEFDPESENIILVDTNEMRLLRGTSSNGVSNSVTAAFYQREYDLFVISRDALKNNNSITQHITDHELNHQQNQFQQNQLKNAVKAHYGDNPNANWYRFIMEGHNEFLTHETDLARSLALHIPPLYSTFDFVQFINGIYSASFQVFDEDIRSALLAKGYSQTDATKLILALTSKGYTPLFDALGGPDNFFKFFDNYEAGARALNSASKTSIVETKPNGLIGSGPAQFFENLSQATIYKWLPGSAERGTVPVLLSQAASIIKKVPLFASRAVIMLSMTYSTTVSPVNTRIALQTCSQQPICVRYLKDLGIPFGWVSDLVNYRNQPLAFSARPQTTIGEQDPVEKALNLIKSGADIITAPEVSVPPSSPASSIPNSSNAGQAIDTQLLIHGLKVVHYQGLSADGNNFDYHLVETPLNNTKFVITPPTKRTTTQAFLETTGSDMAINADGFDYRSFRDKKIGLTYFKTEGPTTYNGLTYQSLGDEKGLYFDSAGKIILDNSSGTPQLPTKPPANARYRISFPNLLIDGGKAINITTSDRQDNSRTAMGIKADGSVFFIAFDGNQTSNGAGLSGASVLDVQQTLLKYGAVIGINFDGGGSTTMVGKDPGGKSILLNTLNADNKGKQSEVASHLGIQVFQPTAVQIPTKQVFQPVAVQIPTKIVVPNGLTVRPSVYGTGECQVANGYCDGTRVYKVLYKWLASQPKTSPWFTNGEFTPADLLAWILMVETKGTLDTPDHPNARVGLLRSFSLDTYNQLWGSSPDHTPYCATPDCQAGGGIFNFLAAYPQSTEGRVNGILRSGKLSQESLAQDQELIDFFTQHGLSLRQVGIYATTSPVSIYNVKNFDFNKVPSGWGAPNPPPGSPKQGDTKIKALNAVFTSNSPIGTIRFDGLYFSGGSDLSYTVEQLNFRLNGTVPKDTQFPVTKVNISDKELENSLEPLVQEAEQIERLIPVNASKELVQAKYAEIAKIRTQIEDQIRAARPGITQNGIIDFELNHNGNIAQRLLGRASGMVQQTRPPVTPVAAPEQQTNTDAINQGFLKDLEAAGLSTDDFIPIDKYQLLNQQEKDVVNLLQNLGVKVYVLSNSKINLLLNASTDTGHPESLDFPAARSHTPFVNSVTINEVLIDVPDIFEQALLHELGHIKAPQVPETDPFGIGKAINENVANDFAYIYLIESGASSSSITDFYKYVINPDYMLLRAKLAVRSITTAQVSESPAAPSELATYDELNSDIQGAVSNYKPDGCSNCSQLLGKINDLLHQAQDASDFETQSDALTKAHDVIADHVMANQVAYASGKILTEAEMLNLFGVGHEEFIQSIQTALQSVNTAISEEIEGTATWDNLTKLQSDLSELLVRFDPKAEDLLQNNEKWLDFQKFVYYTTGIWPTPGNEYLIAQRMEADHYVIKQKYGLPSRDLKYSDVNEYIYQLKQIAQKNNIPIRSAVDYQGFFNAYPMAGAVYENQKKTIYVPSVDVNNKDALLKYASNLEHELIHALQHIKYPGLPIEAAEYEAYTGANMSLGYLKSNPIKAIDAEWSFYIRGSVNFWYEHSKEIKPWTTLQKPPVTPATKPNGLIGSGPAQFFENLAQNTVYKWLPGSAERGTLPVLLDLIKSKWPFGKVTTILSPTKEVPITSVGTNLESAITQIQNVDLKAIPIQFESGTGRAGIFDSNEESSPAIVDEIKQTGVIPNGYLVGPTVGTIFSLMEFYPPGAAPKGIIITDINPEVVFMGKVFVRALKIYPTFDAFTQEFLDHPAKWFTLYHQVQDGEPNAIVKAQFAKITLNRFSTQMVGVRDQYESDRKNSPEIFFDKKNTMINVFSAIQKHYETLRELAINGNIGIIYGDMSDPRILTEISKLPDYDTLTNVVYLSNIANILFDAANGSMSLVNDFGMNLKLFLGVDKSIIVHTIRYLPNSSQLDYHLQYSFGVPRWTNPKGINLEVVGYHTPSKAERNKAWELPVKEVTPQTEIAPVDLTKVTVAPDGDPFVSAEAEFNAESSPALTRRVTDIQKQIANLDSQKVAQIIYDAKYTDGLTGLVNRTGFTEGLSLEITSSNRYGTNLTVVTVDLRQFKAINDTLGHADGDEALKTVAGILKRNSRSTDLVVHISGDEFALILPQTNEAQAKVVMQRILSDLEDLKTLSNKDSFIQGINIDYAIKLWSKTDTVDGFLNDLDLSMYEQKRNTGNPITRPQVQKDVHERTIGSVDPSTLSSEAFDQSPDVLWHGSATPFIFSQNYQYDRNHFESTSGSFTLDAGLYTIPNQEEAKKYSLARQIGIEKKIVVTPLLPYQAKMYDFRTPDLKRNGPVTDGFARSWAQYYLNWYNNQNISTFDVTSRGVRRDYASFMQTILDSKVKQALNVRQLLATSRSSEWHHIALSSPVKSGLFSEFMQKMGYDGIIFIEGGDSPNSVSAPSYVFYNLKVLGDYNSWHASALQTQSSALQVGSNSNTLTKALRYVFLPIHYLGKLPIVKQYVQFVKMSFKLSFSPFEENNDEVGALIVLPGITPYQLAMTGSSLAFDTYRGNPILFGAPYWANDFPSMAGEPYFYLSWLRLGSVLINKIAEGLFGFHAIIDPSINVGNTLGASLTYFGGWTANELGLVGTGASPTNIPRYALGLITGIASSFEQIKYIPIGRFGYINSYLDWGNKHSVDKTKLLEAVKNNLKDVRWLVQTDLNSRHMFEGYGFVDPSYTNTDKQVLDRAATEALSILDGLPEAYVNAYISKDPDQMKVVEQILADYRSRIALLSHSFPYNVQSDTDKATYQELLKKIQTGDSSYVPFGAPVSPLLESVPTSIETLVSQGEALRNQITPSTDTKTAQLLEAQIQQISNQIDTLILQAHPELNTDQLRQYKIDQNIQQRLMGPASGMLMQTNATQPDKKQPFIVVLANKLGTPVYKVLHNIFTPVRATEFWASVPLIGFEMIHDMQIAPEHFSDLGIRTDNVGHFLTDPSLFKYGDVFEISIGFLVLRSLFVLENEVLKRVAKRKEIPDEIAFWVSLGTTAFTKAIHSLGYISLFGIHDHIAHPVPNMLFGQGVAAIILITAHYVAKYRVAIKEKVISTFNKMLTVFRSIFALFRKTGVNISNGAQFIYNTKLANLGRKISNLLGKKIFGTRVGEYIFIAIILGAVVWGAMALHSWAVYEHEQQLQNIVKSSGMISPGNLSLSGLPIVTKLRSLFVKQPSQSPTAPVVPTASKSELQQLNLGLITRGVANAIDATIFPISRGIFRPVLTIWQNRPMLISLGKYVKTMSTAGNPPNGTGGNGSGGNGASPSGPSKGNIKKDALTPFLFAATLKLIIETAQNCPKNSDWARSLNNFVTSTALGYWGNQMTSLAVKDDNLNGPLKASKNPYKRPITDIVAEGIKLYQSSHPGAPVSWNRSSDYISQSDVAKVFSETVVKDSDLFHNIQSYCDDKTANQMIGKPLAQLYINGVVSMATSQNGDNQKTFYCLDGLGENSFDNSFANSLAGKNISQANSRTSFIEHENQNPSLDSTQYFKQLRFDGLTTSIEQVVLQTGKPISSSFIVSHFLGTESGDLDWALADTANYLKYMARYEGYQYDNSGPQITLAMSANWMQNNILDEFSSNLPYQDLPRYTGSELTSPNVIPPFYPKTGLLTKDPLYGNFVFNKYMTNFPYEDYFLINRVGTPYHNFSILALLHFISPNILDLGTMSQQNAPEYGLLRWGNEIQFISQLYQMEDFLSRYDSGSKAYTPCSKM